MEAVNLLFEITVHAGSLPFVRNRAVETARHGQGWQGYDTNHDTSRARALTRCDCQPKS